MAESIYQSLKLWLTGIIPISRDAFHIYIGCLVLLLSLLFIESKKSTIILILPVFVVAIGMETLDIMDDIGSFGYPRWGASLHDIVNTTLIPILFLLVLKIRGSKKF
jgi:hypothetical protein